MTKTYRLIPNQYYPPNGVYSLGQIIASPDADPRFLGRPIEIAKDMEISSMIKKEWVTEIERVCHLKAGIWAQFLQWIGINATTGLSIGSDGRDTCSFKALEINQIERLTDEYLELCMLQKDVTKYLDNYLGKSVFLITGVMIAHGATVSSILKTESSLTAKLGFSGVLQGAVAPSLRPQMQRRAEWYTRSLMTLCLLIGSGRSSTKSDASKIKPTTEQLAMGLVRMKRKWRLNQSTYLTTSNSIRWMHRAPKRMLRL